MTLTTSGNTILDGTTTVVLVSPDTTTGLYAGMTVTGTDMVADTVVVSITNTTTLIISLPATGSTSSATLTFTDLTLAAWLNTTTSVLLVTLPLQDYNSANVYVMVYLSTVGGWVPNNPTMPDGPGIPANSAIPSAAALSIANTQFSSVYDFNFQISIVLNLQDIGKLTPSLSFSSAAATLSGDVSNLLINLIDNSGLPLSISSISGVSYTSNSATVGQTTAAIRQLIRSEIVAGGILTDYKALALQYAIADYLLDDTWNVQSIYTEPNTDIAIIITKYTNTTYNTLDGTNDIIYVIVVGADSHQIFSGSQYTT
jgi:hypothetical protein